MSLEDTIRQIVRDEMRLMKNPDRDMDPVVGDRVIYKRAPSYDPEYLYGVEVGRVGTVMEISDCGPDVLVHFGDDYRWVDPYYLGYDY